ncbi:hypothetical protein ccbrp13_69240 [Ktedonobacteria bacterium brp13]|nr:hypothetical protein ccbrp13_69240 [Ktedonobacteria bacterium brp13]
MRQGNGTDLLGMNDPRSATIGVIYVSPNDDRMNVLAAILTQEKLNREHTLIVLPNKNKAFERAQDFDDLKTVKRKLKGDLIFVVPDAKAADIARQRQFPVYATLEDYIESLREDGADAAAGSGNPDAVKTTPEKRGRLFGNNRRSAAADAAGAAALGGAALGAAEARRNVRTNPGVAYDQSAAPDEQESSSDINTPLPQHGSSSAPAARQPIIPATPKRNMLDDDDAFDAPGPASSTGRRGYIPADKQRPRGRSAPLAGVPVDEDDEDESWEPIGPSAAAGTAGGAIAGAAAARASRSGVPSTPFFNHPNAAPAANAGEDTSDIIDLQPVARGHGNGPRSTLKLNEGATPSAGGIAGTFPGDAVQPSDPPTRRRRTGSMATAAAGGALAAGALAGSAAGTANTHTPGAASAGSAPGIAGRPVPGALPSRRTQPPLRRRRPSRGRVLLLLLLLLLLTAIVATVAWAGLSPVSFQANVTSPLGRMFAAVAPATPATVTIMPASKTEANSFVVHAVTTNPDPANLEVSMRNLTANPPAQTKTVRGTGTAHTPATEAHGSITFSSLNPTAQPIDAGTSFVVNGIHVVTDSSITLQAAFPQASFQTVNAHVTTAGAVGNLAAGAINTPCCAASIRAVSNAFRGGQDPVAYTYVQQSDVDGVVNPLVNMLAQQAKTSFNRQLHANERLAGNPVCTQNTDVPKNQIGPQGSGISSVQVTVSASCTGVVYDYQGAQSVTQQRLQAQATKDLGANYKLIGNVLPAVKNVTQQGNSVTMLTDADGVWVYQFSDSQKQHLAKLLAGKKLADAKSLLAQQTGVQASDIKLNSGDTFPTDPSQITIDIKSVAGLSSGAGNGGTPPVSQPAAPGSTPEAGNGMLLPFFAQVEKFLKG